MSARRESLPSWISRREFLKAAGMVGLFAHSAESEYLTATENSGAQKPRPASPRSVLPHNASKIHREIQETVDEILLIDTHEHLPCEDRFLTDTQEKTDFSLLLSHYTTTDLKTAGMPDEDLRAFHDTRTPLERKWELVARYWERARNTGYGWVKNLAIKGFYGLDGLSEQTYVELTRRMKEAHKPGFYQRILREVAGIDRAVVDIGEHGVDRALFVPALRVDNYILIENSGDLERFSKLAGKPAESVKVLEDVLHSLIAEWKNLRVVAAKCAMAYRRTLRIENVPEVDAQTALDAILANNDAGALKTLQDYLFRITLEACCDEEMPLQIHTGILAGNNNSLEQTNPLYLEEMLRRYPKARIDVFHAGYPWVSELAAIGKTNTCVYADLCWTHAINPAAAQRALDEWLDAMPASKILAFGGDYKFPEGSYGHSIIARTNVGNVLAGRVESGRITMAQAKRIAQMILRENALECFGLS